MFYDWKAKEILQDRTLRAWKKCFNDRKGKLIIWD
jgi:hypothetical protein